MLTVRQDQVCQTQEQTLHGDYRCGLDHEAVLLPVVGHQDDVTVGGPDEAGELQVILGAGRRRLHWRHLVGLNAAELRG